MSEDDRTGLAIDLSRRKRRGERASRHPADRNVLRHSIVEARQVAAPYVTMARIAMARLARDRLARTGALVLSTLAFIGVFADLLASDLPVACRWRGVVYVLPNVTRPSALRGDDCVQMQRDRGPGDWLLVPLVRYGPAQTGHDREALLAPLVQGHPFGTDALGRDVFARVAHGARTALGVGLAASTLLVAIGVGLGAFAGFAGGIVDSLVSRAVEALTAIPTLLLVLVVGALVSHPTTTTLEFTIALTRWPELARLVRGEVLIALGADYVTAARALGVPPPRVLWRHVLPNAIGPAIVGATFAIAWVVLVEATVDFLRVGTPDTMASWGETIGEARAYAHAWWLVAFPGSALLATLVALYLVGEAARNAIDPRLRGDEGTKRG
jgi:peptide/nickel transport system permease protein